MDQMIKKEEFFEYAQFGGNFYGTRFAQKKQFLQK